MCVVYNNSNIHTEPTDQFKARILLLTLIEWPPASIYVKVSITGLGDLQEPYLVV